jgi:hypothetical protein
MKASSSSVKALKLGVASLCSLVREGQDSKKQAFFFSPAPVQQSTVAALYQEGSEYSGWFHLTDDATHSNNVASSEKWQLPYARFFS